MTDHEAPIPADILDYWFSPAVREKWFEANAAFDAELKQRFAPALAMARSGALASWADSPDGALALIVLLDQISRNVHRNTPDAFAGDAVALRTAKDAIARGFAGGYDADQRYALYMPFMHSERLEDRSAALSCSPNSATRKRSTICAATGTSSPASAAFRIATPFWAAYRLRRSGRSWSSPARGSDTGAQVTGGRPLILVQRRAASPQVFASSGHGPAWQG
jgi:uncharacterized protein (DUF924 family)